MLEGLVILHFIISLWVFLSLIIILRLFLPFIITVHGYLLLVSPLTLHCRMTCSSGILMISGTGNWSIS